MTVHLNGNDAITTRTLDDGWTYMASRYDGGQIIVRGEPEIPWEQMHLKAARQLIQQIGEDDALWISGITGLCTMVWVKV